LTGLGLIAIGLGDAVASVAGGRWGLTRIFGTRKTVEGTAASAIVQAFAVTAMCAVTPHLAPPPTAGGAVYTLAPTLAPTVAAVVVGALYEALTLQSDNLVIPLIVWVLVASDVAHTTAKSS
jgi:dolichol kinase